MTNAIASSVQSIYYNVTGVSIRFKKEFIQRSFALIVVDKKIFESLLPTNRIDIL